MEASPRLVACLVALAAAWMGGGPVRADACETAAAGANTLVLTFDGVAFDVVEAARTRGAFAGWPATRPLVSTFPSMTNIAFSSAFAPVGDARMAGYEVRHYDWDQNRVVSGIVGYDEHAGGWRDHYDVMHYSIASKARGYLRPRTDVFHSLDEIERFVLESPQPLMVAHIKGTDILAHFRGNDAVEDVMVDVARRLDALTRAHAEAWDRPLRLLMFSDHGNTERKVHFKRGVRKRLREAGLVPADRLEGPDDVVAPTYGVVSFGVLFTAAGNASRAARAVATHEGVALAAWIEAPGRIRVVTRDAEALVTWHETVVGERFGYRDLGGDPLRLGDVAASLRADGRFDANDTASATDWFERSAMAEFPDAPRRLAESLDGRWVENTATVIFSFEPGHAWGQPKVRFGAWLGGGHQEGTHGGLDRASSLGFLLTNDAGRDPGGPLRMSGVLLPWTDLFSCRDTEIDDAPAAATSPPPAH